MKLMWKHTTQPVVESVQDQTTKAEHLARIPGQDRLTDPRTNPAVRPHADRLRDVQHKLLLDAEHGRIRRRYRVEDRRASHAEKALDALHEAREAASPAKSVRTLYARRTRYMHISLATSIVLAFGSARGLEHLASEYKNIPAGSGYIAEVGLTGLATIVILAKSDLVQHGGRVKGWQNAALWSLMVTPLVASMVANIHGGNAIGAICAAGAAAFAFFSYIVADAFATSARDQAEKVTGDDETDLRKIAIGDDLFALSSEPRTAEEVPEPEFANRQVQVHAEVQEPAVSEVHEPRQVPNHAPELTNPEPRTALPEPEENHEPVNPEPQVHEPAPADPANSEVPNHAPTTPHKPKTKPATNLNDRAQRKAAEVQQVVDLIRERGEDAVTLNVVREELKFAKTTAYHRLVAARELVNQAVAS
ncbi:hypothetical protein AB0K34_14095 [Actinomadura sp. NPDC049382]|uniref:hypothetical protein n=1 Tax=Actinomadura sp. NPDC049382 TaxID=3158220 RepID=UPI00342C1DFB